MLDIRHLREAPDVVNQGLQSRQGSLSIDDILALDVERRTLLQQEEDLRSERNQLSKQIGQLKKAGDDASQVMARSKQVANEIKQIEADKEALASRQNDALMGLPNLPDIQTPIGASEEENVEVSRWGCEFKQRPQTAVKPHYEVGSDLGWLDTERGVKIAKSRFTALRGDIARLNRALIQYMLDVHTQYHGYEEVVPPFIVNRPTMTGTGQLPKFEDDLFRLQDDDLFLIPTAEVPLTNLYAAELLSEEDLPIALTAYTPCFRREAGSAGQDTRGLIRQHQFDKVELVHIVREEESDETHQALTQHAEAILQRLELPYRKLELCTGDLGFSAARCYDLEVWFPAQERYREISSCSNMKAFQARRMNLRYREAETGKPTFAHTLNGSGLAVGRTLAALLENYQISDTEITVPTVLQPYLGGKTRLEPR